MELKLEPEQFEANQEVFIKTIMEAIMVKLVESGLEGRQLEEATAKVAFSVASIVDDTAGIESDGVAIRPYLAFRTDDDELIHCGENAYSYEFVIKLLKEMFP